MQINWRFAHLQPFTKATNCSSLIANLIIVYGFTIAITAISERFHLILFSKTETVENSFIFDEYKTRGS